MFDVDWSDPNRESVGDRRARKTKEKIKEKEKEGNCENDTEHDRKSNDQRSSQTSGSYGSVRSSMSSIEKQFGLFGGKHKRKEHNSVNTTRSTKAKSTKTPSTKTPSSKTQSTASSSLRSPTVTVQKQEQEQEQEQEQDQRADETTASVPYSSVPSSSVPSPTSPRVPILLQHPYQAPSSPRKRLSSKVSPSNDKCFSEAAFDEWDEDAPGGFLLGCGMANPKPGTKTSLVHDLGDGASSITKSIEITSRPRTKADVDYLMSETSIATSCYEGKPKDPTPTKPTLLKPHPQTTETSQYLPTVPESPSPGLDETGPLAPLASESPPSANRDFSKARSRHRPRPRLSAPPIAPASQRHIGNTCLWKAPDAWEYKPTETAVSPVEGPETIIVPTGAAEENSLALDLASMQREAKRMLQASPRAILLRLKGAWGGYDLDASYRDGPTGVCDPAPRATALESALTYKELEMEKKRWMLCALRHMEAVTDPNGVLSMPKVKPRVQRILALFDSQAYFNPGLPIYHLSPDPLSRRQYPNIHPMQCPLISASSIALLPAETTYYSTVNCLPIASVVPSSEIPPLLSRIHGALARGGALAMVVLDPLPRCQSAGPALRRWLDENLVFNLEQQFRCTNPSRNFPVWLQGARLRARGSVITTTRFQAVPPPPPPPRSRGGDGGRRSSDEEEDGDEDESEVATRMELRTVVGRMLWQDIWGPFVTADRWWWDVPEIVDECLGLATHWEYSTIVACKEADD
ncbi:hypothetical protein VPNG_02241 [Cytospora leucostoma]|uniref:Uncharacterized protein n=1 Tax=Cytospora leucostoma TaxID=1230097 RepID=A0A423XGT0_9PEZI|nr:hypothetical protein VPNG_02241 [Cytospora leucostoma]